MLSNIDFMFNAFLIELEYNLQILNLQKTKSYISVYILLFDFNALF